MQKYFLTILFILSFLTVANAAQRGVFVVQSTKIVPYSEAVEGFKSACKCFATDLILSEAEGLNLIREIRIFKPDLILAVGLDALLRLKEIKDTPIVYAMVSNPEAIPSAGTNITGVSMHVTPEKQLALLREAFPELSKIGLLYNPLRAGHFVNKALALSRETGLRIIAKEIRQPKDVLLEMNSLRDKIDLFWMIPDATVFTPETAEYLFLFSYENKIPVFTFSEKYLAMGAVMSANIDARDIGRQAGEMAEKILSGTDVSDMPGADARKAKVSLNPIAAKKLGRPISSETLRRYKVIN